MKIKKITKKPWGQEEIIQTNKFYTIKKITMNSYSRCSLQYHNKKVETIYVLNGPLFIRHGKSLNKLKVEKLNSGQNLTLKNKMIHRMFAKSKKSLYMEVSTSQLNDVVRISDDYNRV